MAPHLYECKRSKLSDILNSSFLLFKAPSSLSSPCSQLSGFASLFRNCLDKFPSSSLPSLFIALPWISHLDGSPSEWKLIYLSFLLGEVNTHFITKDLITWTPKFPSYFQLLRNLSLLGDVWKWFKAGKPFSLTLTLCFLAELRTRGKRFWNCCIKKTNSEQDMAPWFVCLLCKHELTSDP